MNEHHDQGDFEQGVMVDVGRGNGALVIYTGPDLAGAEIEISSARGGTHHSHTEVLRRKTAAGYVNAAVFGSLPEGEYRLWHDAAPDPVDVTVVDGEVTELDWR